jgi:endonuclease G, mitochondrial
VALRQNLLVDVTEQELWYITETAPGSSGAPVFNDSWQVVAVHRLGAPARGAGGEILTSDGTPFIDGIDDGTVVWRANLGASASAVLCRLASACGEHPCIGALLREGRVDAAEALVIPLGSGAQAQSVSHAADARPGSNGAGTHEAPHGSASSNEAITVTVPLRITVRQANGRGRVPAVGVDLS